MSAIVREKLIFLLQINGKEKNIESVNCKNKHGIKYIIIEKKSIIISDNNRPEDIFFTHILLTKAA